MEDSSLIQNEQSQQVYEPTLDPSTNTDIDVSVQVVEINYVDSSQQDQYQPQFMAQQQQPDYQPLQQQQQQQPPQQPLQQQAQPQQYPTQPQINQAYGAQPAIGPFQFPPPAPAQQNNSMYLPQGPQASQQDQYQSQFMAQQQQQDYQPPQQQQQQYQPTQQPLQQQAQPQQYPTQPQINQAYGAQPAAGPVQFPPPAPGQQNNPMCSPQGPQAISSQPVQFPPQNPTQPAAYPSQPIQGQPAQFPPQNPTQPTAYPAQAPQSFPSLPAAYPPQSPQLNPIYPSGPNQPVSYPPQDPQPMLAQPTTGNYPPQGKPQAYPPQAAQQSFTQAAYQSPQPHAVSFAPQNAATQGYNVPPSPYKPTAAQGIPLGMNQMPQQQSYNEQWKTGLFDCMEDPNNALITACFPCVTFGQISEIVDNGQSTCANNGLFYGLIAFCIAMPCIMSCGYRTKLRAKYGLVEAPGPDWAVHCFFEWCALCQEYRELQHRGFEPAIGWQGNVIRQSMQQQQAAMVPPMNQQMMP